jgi:hypothetical protein
MSLSSFLKSIKGLLNTIHPLNEEHSTAEHDKTSDHTETEAVNNDQFKKVTTSAQPEDENQPESQKNTANSDKNDNAENVSNERYTSDNEKKSASAENEFEVYDKQNAALDVTSDTLAEKPVETTPDVYLDVPSLKVQELKLNVEDLDAKVALNAELAGLVKINVGVNVGIKKLDLDIKGIDVKAVLKVRLKQVYNILNRALDTVDNNPDILKKQTLPTPENSMELQNDSTKNRIQSDGRTTDEIANAMKNGDDSIESHHSFKKGEERHRFREDK